MIKKMLLGCVLGVMFVSASYATDRVGFQLSQDSTLNGIYYGDDHKWAAGVNLGYRVDNAPSKTDTTQLGFFLRSNYPLTPDSYVGVGTFVGFNFGRVEGNAINSGYFIYPFVVYEYVLSNNFILTGGVRPVRYEFSDIESKGKTDTWTFLSTFASVAYLF
jgi:hypothetical protein